MFEAGDLVTIRYNKIDVSAYCDISGIYDYIVDANSEVYIVLRDDCNGFVELTNNECEILYINYNDLKKVL